MKKTIIFFMLILSNYNMILSQNFYLYGGKNHDVYLGCITCNKHNSESIWNKFGNYGSKYSDYSIWNKYGTYGSKFNVYSPWNKYSNEAPAILDNEGNFYGYFSTNKYIAKRTQIKWLLDILENWEEIITNFDEYVNSLKLN